MKRVHEKSIILGIGIGIIITSIAGLIFSGGQATGDNTAKMSKEEIIRLAKGYGMVGPVSLIDDTAETTAAASSSTAAASQTTAPDTSAKTTPSKETAPDTSAKTAPSQETAFDTTAQPTSSGAPAKDTSTSSTTAGGDKSKQRDILVEIKAGFDSFEVAELLYSKGVISSKEKFESSLDAHNASTKIKIGTYKFKENDDYDYIIKTICSIK